MPNYLDPKKIAVVIPSYIGGGAETITDIIFPGLMKHYNYSVELISGDMNEHTRPRAQQLGYKVTDLSEYGPQINKPQTKEAILHALKISDAKHIVFAVVFPDDAEHFRSELPGRNIIFHLHSLPLWQATDRVMANRKAAQALGTASSYISYRLKALKEKWFKVYTRRYAKRYRKMYDYVDQIIVLTDSYRRQLNKIMGHKADNDPNSRISTLYNPFDPAPLAVLANTPKRKEILYVGRLNCVDKGVDHLIRAWNIICRDYPDWTLKIVGEGPDKGYLEWLVDALSTTSVEFCGYSSDPASHYATASILCMTSNFEGWGMALIEAMAAGVVPLAVDCSDGVHEVLDEGRGILVEPGSDAKIAKGLRHLIEHPEELANRRRLYPIFLKKFDVLNTISTFNQILQK